MAAVIGSLRAELSATIAVFEGDMDRAAAAVEKFGTKFTKIGDRMTRAGAKMSLAITAPLVLFAKLSYDAAKESSQAIGQVEAALKSMGNQSGKTAAELQKSAKGLQNSSLYDDDEILRKVTANLLTFGNVAGDVFDRAQQAAVNMSARLGEDLQASAIRVGKALNDPVQGLTALRRVGVQFTSDQEKMIKKMVESGHGFDAQRMILKELEREFGGAAAAMRAASPDAAAIQSWRDFQETVGAILFKVLPPLTAFLQKVLDGFNSLSPGMQQTIVVVGAVVAAIGPLLVMIGSLISAIGNIAKAAPLVVSGLKLITQGLIALLAMDPVILLIAAVAAALGVVAVMAFRAIKPTKDVTQATTDLAKATDAYAAAAGRANGLTGEARKNAIDEAKAKRAQALATLDSAKAKLAEARATLAQIAADEKHNGLASNFPIVGPLMIGIGRAVAKRQASQNADALQKQVDQAEAQIKAADVQIGLAKAPSGGGGGGAPTYNFNTGGGNSADKVKSATEAYKKAIADLNDAVSHGLDERALPKAMSDAEALRRKIDEITASAKESGVNVKAYAGEIDALRARIADLETKGIADEARKFGEEVDKDARSVNEFARGGLTSLQAALQEVDDNYASLKQQIEDHIRENAVLADKNADAAKAMEVLKGQLAALETAHAAATAAAKAQYAAENDLANLRTQLDNLDTAQQLRDLKQASGQGGVLSKHQEKLQSIQDDLDRQRLEAVIKLKDLQKQLDDAKVRGDTDETKRLLTQIDLQSQLGDLLSQVTAAQLDAAETQKEAWQSFEDQISEGLMHLGTDGKSALQIIKGAFDKLAEDLFMKKGADQISNWIADTIRKAIPGQGGGQSGPWNEQPGGMTQTSPWTEQIDQAGQGMADKIDGVFQKNSSGGFVASLQNIFSQFGSSIGNFFSSIFGGGGGQGGGFMSSIGNFFSQIMGSSGGAGGGGSGMMAFFQQIGTVVSSFMGGFDSGGRMTRGGWGIVGENGPEIFAPSKSGYVVPHEEAFGQGHGSPVVQTFNITTPDANSFMWSQRQISRRAKRGLASA